MIAIVLSVYSVLLLFDTLSVFQQVGYSVKKYNKWLYKSKNRILFRIFISVLPLLFLSAVKEIVSFDELSYAVFYCLLAYLCAFAQSGTVKTRVKAKFSKRFLRILILSAVLSFFVYYAFDLLIQKVFRLTACYSFVLIWLYPYIVAISAVLWLPYERILYRYFVNRCKKNLSKNKKLIRIGITGSAGKTSVKNYLYEMLSVDYKTYATPKSFNTPLGICIAVKEMPKDTEVFIAEMGARKRGDIKTLCDIVRPSVGIITSITKQHMETFGTVENLKKTKFELIEGLTGDSVGVFSSDDEGARSLYERAEVKKISAGINGVAVRAENIKLTPTGTEFTIIIGGERYPVRAKLLGRANVTNICVSASVAYELGVSPERIVLAIGRLKPPPHRLEFYTAPSGVTVIDDGYNANLKGVMSSAEMLKEFDGRKFAVVSGIAEGGKYSEELNEEVGKALKDAVAVLVAVGTYSDFIINGAKGGKCRILKVSDLKNAESVLKSELKRGDTVIFINDLPDSYI